MNSQTRHLLSTKLLPSFSKSNVFNWTNSFFHFQCMVHSWYLPCDFHYFIIAVFLCMAIQKHKKVGLVLLGVITFLSVLVPFIIGLIHMRPAVLFFYSQFLRAPKLHPDFLLSYSKSHTRASPYFVGMIAGYIFYRMKGSEKCLKEVSRHILHLIDSRQIGRI